LLQQMDREDLVALGLNPKTLNPLPFDFSIKLEVLNPFTKGEPKDKYTYIHSETNRDGENLYEIIMQKVGCFESIKTLLGDSLDYIILVRHGLSLHTKLDVGGKFTNRIEVRNSKLLPSEMAIGSPIFEQAGELYKHFKNENENVNLTYFCSDLIRTQQSLVTFRCAYEWISQWRPSDPGPPPEHPTKNDGIQESATSDWLIEYRKRNKEEAELRRRLAAGNLTAEEEAAIRARLAEIDTLRKKLLLDRQAVVDSPKTQGVLLDRQAVVDSPKTQGVSRQVGEDHDMEGPLDPWATWRSENTKYLRARSLRAEEDLDDISMKNQIRLANKFRTAATLADARRSQRHRFETIATSHPPRADAIAKLAEEEDAMKIATLEAKAAADTAAAISSQPYYKPLLDCLKTSSIPDLKKIYNSNSKLLLESQLIKDYIPNNTASDIKLENILYSLDQGEPIAPEDSSLVGNYGQNTETVIPKGAAELAVNEDNIVRVDQVEPIAREVSSLVGKYGLIKKTVIPTGAAELAVKEGNKVRVVNLTSAHWWRVRDNSGNEGYVSPQNLELLD
jgi:hypothetical protein